MSETTRCSKCQRLKSEHCARLHLISAYECAGQEHHDYLPEPPQSAPTCTRIFDGTACGLTETALVHRTPAHCDSIGCHPFQSAPTEPERWCMACGEDGSKHCPVLKDHYFADCNKIHFHNYQPAPTQPVCGAVFSVDGIRVACMDNAANARHRHADWCKDPHLPHSGCHLFGDATRTPDQAGCPEPCKGGVKGGAEDGTAPCAHDVAPLDRFDQSMDARVWAQAWLRIIAENPGIPTDEGAMIGWFANAIMRGYDEARRKYEPPTPAPEPAFWLVWITGGPTEEIEGAEAAREHAERKAKEYPGVPVNLQSARAYVIAEQPEPRWHRAGEESEA